MSDTNEKSKYYERKPNFDFQAKLSKDGRYWVIRRIETWIVPRKYMDVIAENHVVQMHQQGGKEPPHRQLAELEGKPKSKRKRNANSNG